MKALKILFLSILTLVGITLLWRWFSRHRSLPCPTWLAGMLENTWTDRLIGTQKTLIASGCILANASWKSVLGQGDC